MMMLLLLIEIYTSFMLFVCLSYCDAIKTQFTSGLKGLISITPQISSSQISPIQSSSSSLSSQTIQSSSSSSSTTTTSQISSLQSIKLNVNNKQQPQATYFTGAGIYFFWQCGVAKYLQENTDIQNRLDIPIIGASAGSLTATILLCNIDFNYAKNVAIRLATEANIYERGNLIGILGQLLRQWLEEIIPDDIDVNRLRNLYIAVTPLTKSPKLVSNFKNKNDIINACMASCHLPFLLNGNVLTNYKGESVMDGSFWYFVTKNRFTGLPLLDKKIQDYFWIDYGDDSKFMQSISGNIIELVDEQKLESMFLSGYTHMKREHAKGKLPFTYFTYPTTINFNDIIQEEGMSNFFVVKTIGNMALKSKEIQTLIENNNNENNNNKNNKNNKNENKKINKKINNWGGIEGFGGVEPFAATLSSLFSEDKSGFEINMTDLFSLTSIVL